MQKLTCYSDQPSAYSAWWWGCSLGARMPLADTAHRMALKCAIVSWHRFAWAPSRYCWWSHRCRPGMAAIFLVSGLYPTFGAKFRALCQLVLGYYYTLIIYIVISLSTLTTTLTLTITLTSLVNNLDLRLVRGYCSHWALPVTSYFRYNASIAEYITRTAQHCWVAELFTTYWTLFLFLVFVCDWGWYLDNLVFALLLLIVRKCIRGDFMGDQSDK